MSRIGLDLGYGDGKLAFVANGKLVEIKFPTAVCFAEKNMYSEHEENYGYEFNGERYLVGKDALLNTLDSRSPDFLIKYAPLFVAHAIDLAKHKTGLKVSDVKILATGLSILNWKKRDELRDRLTDFKVSGTRYKFTKVVVVPQGQGIIWDHKLEKSKNVVVIDGGFFTLDGLPFQGGSIVKGAFANRNGISQIVEEVKVEIVEMTNVDYTLVEVNKIIQDGYLMAHGEKIDLKDVVKRAVEKYIQMLMETLNTKMSSHLSKASTVIISGGLAYFLKNTKMPKNVVYSKRPEFANARGYYRLAGGKL